MVERFRRRYTINSYSRISNSQCSPFSKQNPIIRTFCISRWLAVPINPGKWSSTVFCNVSMNFIQAFWEKQNRKLYVATFQMAIQEVAMSFNQKCIWTRMSSLMTLLIRCSSVRLTGKSDTNEEGSSPTDIGLVLETQSLLGPQSNSNVSASLPGESWLDMSSHRMLQATDAGRGRVLKIAQSTCCRTLRSQNNLQHEHDTSGRIRLHTAAKRMLLYRSSPLWGVKFI